jgi:hypothetical protein
MQNNKKAVKFPQRKPNSAMADKELETKIYKAYNKSNPQPETLKDKVKIAINKLENK